MKKNAEKSYEAQNVRLQNICRRVTMWKELNLLNKLLPHLTTHVCPCMWCTELFPVTDLFTTFSRAVSRCMSAAISHLLEWVHRCSTELFDIFAPDQLNGSVTQLNRKTRPDHCSRQLFIKGPGSGRVWIASCTKNASCTETLVISEVSVPSYFVSLSGSHLLLRMPFCLRKQNNFHFI